MSRQLMFCLRLLLCFYVLAVQLLFVFPAGLKENNLTATEVILPQQASPSAQTDKTAVLEEANDFLSRGDLKPEYRSEDRHDSPETHGSASEGQRTRMTLGTAGQLMKDLTTTVVAARKEGADGVTEDKANPTETVRRLKSNFHFNNKNRYLNRYAAENATVEERANLLNSKPGGTFNNLNSILRNLVLPLDLNIEPKEASIQTSVLGFSVTVELLATIGDVGECRDLFFRQSLGGDIFVSGKFLEGTFSIPGVGENLQAYEIEIFATKLNFECDIPMKVEVESFGIIPTGALNTVDGFGRLTFNSNKAELTQTVIAYSPDFQTSPPIFSEPGSCFADPVDLDYEGEDLGSVVGISFTDTVIEELEADNSLVFSDVQTELCFLANDLALEISTLLVQNELTNTSSDFYISDPFTAAETTTETDGAAIPALEAEALLYSTGVDQLHELFNWTDRDDFFVQLLLPNETDDGEEENNPILNTILEFFTDAAGFSEAVIAAGFDEGIAVDPFLLFLDEQFNLSLAQNGGNIVDLDLITVFDGSFFGLDEGEEVEPVDLSFNFNTTFNESLFVNLTMEVLRLELDVVPPKVNSSSVLPSFEALGRQTLLIPGLNLSETLIDGDVRISLQLVNTRNEENLFLTEPFDLSIEEVFSLQVDWDGFVADIGVLLALDYDDLLSVQFGPLLEEVFDCVISSFIQTPLVTGVTIDHSFIGIDFSQFNDAILVAVADIVEVMIPIYQPIIPRALELVAADVLTNQQLIDPTECAESDVSFDDVELFPFNFSQGLFKAISEASDADLFNE